MTALTALPLTGLNVSRCKLSSAGLSSIAKIAPLEWLSIDENGIDDISPLAKLKNLRWLHVGKNPLGASANAIGALSALIELYADECALDDDFATALSKLQKLRRFFAWGNSISDASVPEMARAKGLRIVNLVDNPLSNAGRRQLAKRLPNCTFEW